jgi:hypothetical protein
MGKHVNESFLNKFLGKNLLSEEQKITIALKNRKQNYIKAYQKRLEEKNQRKLSSNLNEELSASIGKIFYRTKEQLQEARNGMQNLIPYHTPYGIIFFNKDTQEWTNTFGQVVDPMDFMTDFSFDDSANDGDGRTSQNIIVPPLPPELYPNPPKDLQVVSFDLSGATLSWIDDSINEQGFKLFYYKATILGPQPSTDVVSPSGFTGAAISNTEISLSWNDTSFNELGYKIYYRAVVDGVTSPAPPTSFAAERIDPTTIQLTWVDTATDEDGFKIFYLEE